MINTTNYVFGRYEIEYRSTLQAIRNCKDPVTVKDLRRFLDALNYYRQSIHKTGEQNILFHDLRCQPKNKDIVWSTEANEAFQQCGEAITEIVLLVQPPCY